MNPPSLLRGFALLVAGTFLGGSVLVMGENEFAWNVRGPAGAVALIGGVLLVVALAAVMRRARA